METKKIDQREFEGILELAVNPGSGNALEVICTNLSRKLGIDEPNVSLNDLQDTANFEEFITATIDEHGLNFTGRDAVTVAKEWIGQSQNVTVPAYQKKVPII